MLCKTLPVSSGNANHAKLKMHRTCAYLIAMCPEPLPCLIMKFILKADLQEDMPALGMAALE